ncbi:hypothetical protein SKAU_G00214650 [Synaphobranchus kaupii]|uniref:Uncharacterized protein n=1 Tax=Synaphobranchus kaupii TaxID=118154 RepID=A0A9Q1IVD9_SYNKA|nr:hypothetical protein SKAU_G00214650 [Synaphobranchus kaupii]
MFFPFLCRRRVLRPRPAPRPIGVPRCTTEARRRGFSPLLPNRGIAVLGLQNNLPMETPGATSATDRNLKAFAARVCPGTKAAVIPSVSRQEHSPCGHLPKAFGWQNGAILLHREATQGPCTL